MRSRTRRSMPRVLAAVTCLVLMEPIAARQPEKGASPEVPDLPVEKLLERIQEVQAGDIEAWHRYEFRRRVVRESLDEEGDVQIRESKELVLKPETDGGFDERLISLDDEEPPRSAVMEHGRKREFTGKYRSLRGEDGGTPARRGFTLDQLTELAGPELAGQERIDGVACWRIDFHPVPEEEAGGRAADRLRQAMEGSLWVTLEDLHVVRARARTVRPVRFYWILAKVHSLEVSLDQLLVAPGTWLPGRIVLDIDRRILFDRDRRHTTWTYSGYERVR